MRESEAQSALASASPEGSGGERKKPAATSSIPPWKRSGQEAAASAKSKETDDAGTLTAPLSADDVAATKPSWTRPSLTTHHAAETVEKYVASPSNTSHDEASPTAASSGGGGQAEIVEEHSLSVSAAKNVFGGTAFRSSPDSKDRAERWKAEAAAASASFEDDNVVEDRTTSITVTDSKSVFDRPARSFDDELKEAISSRPKWLTGAGISGSPPSASTGSGVSEAYAELFGVAHEEEEEELWDIEVGGDGEGGRPAWLGQSESGGEATYKNRDENVDDITDDAPDKVPEPAVAGWLQVDESHENMPSGQDEVVKSEEEMDKVDESHSKKRGWGKNLVKWIEERVSDSGSGSGSGSDESNKESPMQEDGNVDGPGTHDDDEAEQSRREEEEAILAMMEAENQRHSQGQEVAANYRASHDANNDAEIGELEAFEHEDARDEDSIQQDPADNIVPAAVGTAIAGAGVAVATVAATSAPAPNESVPIDSAPSPTPDVEAGAEAGAETGVMSSDEENFDDYAGNYYSKEDSDCIEQDGKASTSVPPVREMSDGNEDEDYSEEYDEYLGNAGSYSDRSTEGLEANLSSAYGLGAADNDDFYHDRDDYLEDLDDDTEQDAEASYDADVSYTTIDKLEDEFLAATDDVTAALMVETGSKETGERSSQKKKVDEGENARPSVYPEDSEPSLDNTALADERERSRQVSIVCGVNFDHVCMV